MNPTRPARLVFVTGTATEVGKTWVAAALLQETRRRGLEVAVRKPVQSSDPGPDPHSPDSPVRDSSVLDSSVLGAASGESAEVVCPHSWTYPVAMAPPMAAEVVGVTPPSIAELAQWVTGSWPAGGTDLGVVEGAGGVASPLGGDGDNAALAGRLGVDLAVLVATPGLGAINSVRLSVAALAPLAVVVHLNRFDRGDGLHQRNLEWLRQRDGMNVTTSVAALFDAVMSPGQG